MITRPLISLLFLLLLAGCVEPFDPPEIVDPEEIIIIEGTLDNPDGKARVVLSRIRNLNSPLADSLNARISGANVQIVVDGNSYGILETEIGVYTSYIPVQTGSEARLVVEFAGNVYESSEVTVDPVPEIDSITFSADDNGVTIEVTTGDDANDTQFYQWTYMETAQYRTQFSSDYYFDGIEVQQRHRDDQRFYCWKTIPSTSIVVATTEGLAENVVYKYPVHRIPDDSWKKEISYSLLLHQYSISEEAYRFLRELENNTENVGSLFDPQPGRIFGNIRNVTNPNEYVLGLFSARDRKTKRFFLDMENLPSYPSVLPVCNLQAFDTLSVEEVNNLTQPTDLMGAILNLFGNVIGYTRAYEPRCQDCRLLRGGTNIEPDYWE